MSEFSSASQHALIMGSNVDVSLVSLMITLPVDSSQMSDTFLWFSSVPSEACSVFVADCNTMTLPW